MVKKIKKQAFPSGRVVVDFETNDLTPYNGGRAFICGAEDEAGNVIKARPGDSEWHKIEKIFEDPTIEKISHGARFEIKHARHLGLKPAGKFHDTMCKAVLVDEYQKISLDALAQRWLKDDSKGVVKAWLKTNNLRIKRQTGREPNYSDVPKEIIEPYLEGDLDKTMRLNWLWQEVELEFPEIYKMEIDLAYDVASMEDMGFTIDLSYIEKMIKKLQPELGILAKQMHLMVGASFNPASHFDLGKALLAIGLDTGITNANGSMKTNSKSLQVLGTHPFLTLLNRWRVISKILGTYLIPFTQKAIGNVIHGNLWQYGQDEGIVTGRFSSSGPNLQNIPGSGYRTASTVPTDFKYLVRKAIIPPSGYDFIFFDYKQIEMMIFTCYAKDTRAIADLQAGIDPYIANGKLLYGEKAFNGLDEDTYTRKRFGVKELCLCLLYGMGLKTMATFLKSTIPEAKKMRDTYFAASPKTREFMISIVRDLLVNGYVQDVFGRHYHVPQDRGYKAVNAVCQGAAATVMKQGIIRARPLQSLGFKPIVPIHDELMGIVPKDKKIREEVAYEGSRLLRDAYSFEVPIEVDVTWSDTNWAEKKHI